MRWNSCDPKNWSPRSGKFLIPEIPDVNDIADVGKTAQDLLNNLGVFLRLSLSRLGTLAEKVESAFGFEPLVPPQEVIDAE